MVGRSRYHRAMTSRTAIEHILEGRTLLSHPFYRRWEAGELAEGELAAYGAQYAHFERQLPETLAATVERCPEGTARTSIAANLDDELHRPRPHVDLLGTFLDAVGATPTPPTPATSSLVALYADAPRRGAGFAVGVLAAYEVQAGAIARSKAEGLRTHYGLDREGTAFWDVHATLEDEHAAWTLDAADGLDHDEVLCGVAASREAWWSFLDERDAEVAVSR
jgi:pyrroloquinoline-quinone synthase